MSYQLSAISYQPSAISRGRASPTAIRHRRLLSASSRPLWRRSHPRSSVVSNPAVYLHIPSAFHPCSIRGLSPPVSSVFHPCSIRGEEAISYQRSAIRNQPAAFIGSSTLRFSPPSLRGLCGRFILLAFLASWRLNKLSAISSQLSAVSHPRSLVVTSPPTHLHIPSVFHPCLIRGLSPPVSSVFHPCSIRGLSPPVSSVFHPCSIRGEGAISYQRSVMSHRRPSAVPHSASPLRVLRASAVHIISTFDVLTFPRRFPSLSLSLCPSVAPSPRPALEIAVRRG